MNSPLISHGLSTTWQFVCRSWVAEEDALEVIKEAVNLCRRLAADSPVAFNLDLAFSLHVLANCSSDLESQRGGSAGNQRGVALWNSNSQNETCYSTVPFRSIRHSSVTVTRWINPTLRHKWLVTMTKWKFRHFEFYFDWVWWWIGAAGSRGSQNRPKSAKSTKIVCFRAKSGHFRLCHTLDLFDTGQCDVWQRPIFDRTQRAVTRDCRIDWNGTVLSIARLYKDNKSGLQSSTFKLSVCAVLVSQHSIPTGHWQLGSPRRIEPQSRKFSQHSCKLCVWSRSQRGRSAGERRSSRVTLATRNRSTRRIQLISHSLSTTSQAICPIWVAERRLCKWSRRQLSCVDNSQQIIPPYSNLILHSPSTTSPTICRAWVAEKRLYGWSKKPWNCIDNLRKIFRPHSTLISQCLSRQSSRLFVSGRREGALQVMEEAVGLRRQLARDLPVAFHPALAQSLNNLSLVLSNLGRLEDALQVIQEAVELSWQLATDRPAVFNVDLASSLNNLANRLCDLGRPKEALQSMKETATRSRSSRCISPRSRAVPQQPLSCAVRPRSPKGGFPGDRSSRRTAPATRSRLSGQI